MTIERGPVRLFHYLLLAGAHDFRVSFDVEVPHRIYPLSEDTDDLTGYSKHDFNSYDAVRYGYPGTKSPGRIGFLFRSEDGTLNYPADYIGPPSGMFRPGDSPFPPFPFERGQYAERGRNGTPVSSHVWNNGQPTCYMHLGEKPRVSQYGYQPPIPIEGWACFIVFTQFSGDVQRFTYGGGYASKEISVPIIDGPGVIREWNTTRPFNGEMGQVNSYELIVQGDQGTLTVNGERFDLVLDQRSDESSGLWLVADPRIDTLQIKNLVVESLD